MAVEKSAQTQDSDHQDSEQPPTLEIQALRKEFPVGDGVEVAVDDVSFEITEGNFVTLVGPSGCGKTTTLRCIAGLETPTAGKILLNSKEVTDVPANKRDMAMMFQSIALYPHMTVIDNISYPLKVERIPKEERYEQAREAGRLMQIEELLEKHPGDLSGGQRQRAALARTVVQDPEVFLLDEPLSDLDAKLKTEIRKEIQKVHKRVNRPTIYVTHDQEEAMTMSDYIAVMNDGKIEQFGTPEEVYRYPENQFVAEFIGNPTMNFMGGKLNKLENNEASVTLEGNTFNDIKVEAFDTRPPESEIIVGFRPDHVNLDEKGGIDCNIQLLERTGPQFLATLDGPQGELRALVSADHSLVEGNDTKLTINQNLIHLFDPENGETLAHAID